MVIPIQLLLVLASVIPMARCQLITSAIPTATKISFPTEKQSRELFLNQQFQYTLPSKGRYIYNRITNLSQGPDQEMRCSWLDSQNNFSSVGVTRDLNMSLTERLVAVGSAYNGHTYYLLTNESRLISLKTEISTRSLKISKSQNLTIKVNQKVSLERVGQTLVFVSDNTLVTIDEGQVTYKDLGFTDPIIKTMGHHDHLYILTQKTLKRWHPDTPEQIHLGDDVDHLVDFDVDGQGKMYVLNSNKGIYVVSGQYSKEYLFPTVDGYFTKIRVMNYTIECVYVLQKSNFVVELYLYGGGISINKIYPVNSHVNEMILLESYGVLVHDYHLTLLQHSTNRHIPQLDYKDLLRSLLLVGVKNLFRLQGDMVIIMTDKTASIAKQIELNLPKLHCDFSQAGVYTLAVQYALPNCTTNSIPSDPIKQYCVYTKQFEITVKEGRRPGTVVFAYVMFGIIISVGLFVVAIGVVYCAKQIQKKQNAVSHMIEKQKLNQIKATNDHMNVTHQPAQGNAQ